ncbi:hypothetical protein DFH09DRAFT_1024107 [Mycena vulgaris]|nr:hypothetical protein DFH09DRAFT_1024107 [Mycena vulgaris]
MTDVSPKEYPAPPLSLEILAAWHNELLPPQDALIARPWLLGAEDELTRMNEEIRRLESRRDLFLRPVEVYRAALAPHKLLNVDSLREIFLSVARSTISELPQSGHPDVRLTISHVCSGWRSVALDMPELWSNVRVRLRLTLPKLLDIWLSRSGTHPLSLNIENAHASSVVPFLTQYSHRTRSLSLDRLSPFMSPLRSMDKLETLYIDNSFYRVMAPLTVLFGAACLRSVTLRSFEADDLKLVDIPWTQLTELYLDNTDFVGSQYYPILEGCTTLTTARLDMFKADPP